MPAGDSRRVRLKQTASHSGRQLLSTRFVEQSPNSAIEPPQTDASRRLPLNRDPVISAPHLPAAYSSPGTGSFFRNAPNRVFFCRAAHLELARAADLGFHGSNQDLTTRFAMVKNRLRHRSREVAIAVAITLAAVAAVIATLSSQEEDPQTAEPMALVTPKR
jgi:hypothetical protein